MKAKTLLNHPDTKKNFLHLGYLVAVFYTNETLNRSIVEHKENGIISYRGNPNVYTVSGDMISARRVYRQLLDLKYKP